VIINGDFWDGYKISFDKFVNSKWAELFPLLKQKHTIYIWGNHDSPDRVDNRVSWFSDMHVPNYALRVNGYELVIEHGHRLDPIFGVSHPPRILKPINYGYMGIEGASMRINHRLGKFFFLNKSFVNLLHKRYARKHMLPHQILVCGHSHRPAYSLENKYINLGDVYNHVASYAIVDPSGLTLHKEFY
jgi:UDP-2,3-diacylglucosamine pyrophosphatase LpxH